jgi:hypothetical protein
VLGGFRAPCLQIAIAGMARLSLLTSLNLEGTVISDERFVNLCSNLPRLQALSVKGVKIADGKRLPRCCRHTLACLTVD